MAGALALALCGLLLAFQRHLLFPRPKRRAVLQAGTHHILALQLPVAGTRLQVWMAEPKGSVPAARGALYLNGRREHPTSIFNGLHRMPGVRVVCFRYRGLGLSWRKPDEAQLVADALAVLDWMGSRYALAPEQITVTGRSLGSGIAVAICAVRPVRRLALISPFDQALHAIRIRLPFVRRWMLKDHFRSDLLMPRISCPVLLVVGERDRTVPPALSYRLLANWPGDRQDLLLKDMGHRGLLRDARVQQHLGDFCV